MPAPAVYVLAILGTVAAGVAFHEFIYEPHIAPKIERWAEEFIARRRARRAAAMPMPVAAVNPHTPAADPPAARTATPPPAIELVKLTPREADVHEWRSAVALSQPGLRRRPAAPLDEANAPLPYTPLDPTHVIFDSSAPSSPSSAHTPAPAPSDVSSRLLASPTVSSRAESPPPRADSPAAHARAVYASFAHASASLHTLSDADFLSVSDELERISASSTGSGVPLAHDAGTRASSRASISSWASARAHSPGP